MQLLKKRILQDGKCYEGGILKVDGFINHQMDPVLMKSIGVEFVRRFAWTYRLYSPKRNHPKPFRTH